MKKSLWIVIVIAGVLQLSGVICASYGVLRESFANLAQERGYGEGRYGEGTYGGGPTRIQEVLIKLGTKMGLLPPDRTLTLTDRKTNAAWAITGVILGVLGTVIDLIVKLTSKYAT